MTIIGLELISSEIVAITELVKNSFDADARFVLVRITGEAAEDGSIKSGTGAIIILDDGHGMDEETIISTWLEPATGFRRLSTTTLRGRRVLGEKGVGRFAAAKLGSKLELTSKTETSDEVHLAVDWSEFEDDSKYLDEIEIELGSVEEGQFGLGRAISKIWQKQADPYLDTEESVAIDRGTLLTITKLRSAWSKDLVKEISLSLSRLVSPFDEAKEIDSDFTILLDLPDGFDTSGPIERPSVLQHPHYRLVAEVDDLGNATVLIEVHNGEEHVKDHRLHCSLELDRLRSGPFEVRLNVWDRDAESLRGIVENLHSVTSVRSILDSVSGISIYRDGFRVLPFGEKDDDWLRLDHRRVQNPTQRLSNNQIVGYVLIGRDTNPGLIDQTNREGLIEGPALDDLRSSVTELLGLLESERYKIRPRQERRKRGGLLERIDLGELKSTIADDRPDYSSFLDKLAEVQKDVDDRIEKIGEVLSRYHRLATLGQLVDGVVHELAQPIVAIRQASTLGAESVDRADRELAGTAKPHFLDKVSGYFALISKQSRTANDVVRRIAPFGGRRRGRPRNVKIEGAVEDAVALVRADIESAGVVVYLPTTTHEVTLDGTDIQEVVVNLITNCLYWLKRVERDSRFIRIEVERNDDGSLVLMVEDSGPGVPENDRDYIFDPYFTTKVDGVGLGLSIAGEIVSDYYGGELELLSPGSLGGARFRATFRRRVG